MKWLTAVLLVLVGVVGFVTALLHLYRTEKSYQVSREVYQVTAESAVTVKPDLGLPDVDFSALQDQNEDVIGWLFCPDTNINYPVVQGADNTHYLTHLIDGSEGAYGTLFLDSEANPTDKNQVIYGHHMKDGAMLAGLTQYREQSYYDTHPVLYYLTPKQAYEVRLFAGFTTTAVSSVYNRTFDKADFTLWLAEMLYQSDFMADFALDEQSQVLTLSTCDYSAKNARYVVIGVLNPIEP